jgi:hypothetical protein
MVALDEHGVCHPDGCLHTQQLAATDILICNTPAGGTSHHVSARS